jgi:hypothetical protein
MQRVVSMRDGVAVWLVVEGLVKQGEELGYTNRMGKRGVDGWLLYDEGNSIHENTSQNPRLS